MIQVALRTWPAGAVHDTVSAVMQTAPFRRQLQDTVFQRLMSWLGQGIRWVLRQFEGIPGGRTAVYWLLALLVAALVLKVVLAARARDPEAEGFVMRGRARAGEDPWRAAERLAAAGDHEGAAHALYRGVVASVAERERLRLHPSKTSGDYARELRARGSSAHQPFRAFARRFDTAIYGHGRIDAELVRDLLQLAGPLRTPARAA